MPQIDRFTFGILAMVAEKECEATSARTSAALQAKIARGDSVGNHNLGKTYGSLGGRVTAEARIEDANTRDRDALSMIELLQAKNMTLRAIADTLNRKKFGGRNWSHTAVRRALARAEYLED